MSRPDKPKAIVLLSGGLDSTLAVKMMLDQGVETLAVNFVSPFCTCSPRKEGSCHLAAEVAASLGVPLRTLSKGTDYLKIVERPNHGYGRALNPCIDCRIFMLRRVAEFMEAEGFGFVVTGEVLGQRPMSQHREAMAAIERESGLSGRIVRPLCAQWLEPTLPEQKGWVDRSRLLAIQGRSRSEQLARAKEGGLDVFGCPSGGCLLTVPLMGRRLRDMFAHNPDYGMRDAKLVAIGRHFRLHDGLKVVLGRRRAENERLAALGFDWPRLELADVTGPLMVLRGAMRPQDKPALGRLLRRFAPHAGNGRVTVRCAHGEREQTWRVDRTASDEEIRRWEI